MSCLLDTPPAARLYQNETYHSGTNALYGTAFYYANLVNWHVGIMFHPGTLCFEWPILEVAHIDTQGKKTIRYQIA